MSVSGISFLSDTRVRLGWISLVLRYSEHEEALGLDARIIYIGSHGAGLTYRYRIGAEFCDFSNEPEHNSLKALGVLQQLEAAYAPNDP